MKTCPQCGADHAGDRCLPCGAARARQWRAEHPDRAREIARNGNSAWRARQRRKKLASKLSELVIELASHDVEWARLLVKEALETLA